MPPLFPDPPPAFLGGQATLTGRVVDSLSNLGVAGATVFLREAGTWAGSSGSGPGPARALYATDPHGIFRIHGLRDRRYHLDVEAPGYLRSLATVALGMAQRHPSSFLDDLRLQGNIEGGFWHVDWDRVFGRSELLGLAFPLVENGRAPAVTLILQPGKTLRGAVRDLEGRPLPGAVVTIESQGFPGYHPGSGYWGLECVPPNRPTSTDAEGLFRLTVPAGCQLKLLVQAPGRPEERRSLDLLSHEGPVEITMGGGQTLRGRVLGHSHSHLRLIAFEPRPEGRVWETEASRDGAFTFDGVVGERWVVAASSFPCGGAAAALVQSLDVPLELTLQDGRSIEGKVVDAAGAPQPGAIVGQNIVIRHPTFTAKLGSHDEDKRIKAGKDGVLGIPTWLQGGHAQADADGRFRMETILDQQGQVMLHAYTQETGLDLRHGEGWCPLGAPATLVVARQDYGFPAPGPRAKDVDVLLEHLRSGPVERRRKLIAELRRELDHGADRLDLLPHFLLGLADEDADVRRDAALALGELKRPEAFAPLAAAARHEDWSVRHYAIAGLARHGAQAEPLLREILKEEKSAQLRVLAAGVLVEIGAPVDVQIFYRALREDSDWHGLEAKALVALGRKEAIELLIDALRRTSADFGLQEALHKLTGTSEHMGARRWQYWLDENRASLPPQAPLEVEPPDAESCVRRGVRLHREGHPERALEFFSRALDLAPGDVDALRWRGYLRLERGEWEGAEADFTRLLEVAPDGPNDWLFRAQARARRKDAAGARADLEKALGRAPADWPYRETARRLLAELN